MRVRGVFFILLLLGLCSGAQAQAAWEPLAEGDGYRSSLGVVRAQEEPQPAGAVLNTAQAFGGISYQWAGTSPETGFDCSGYIYEVLRLNGYDVPRMADQQFHETERVAYEDLLPGDLVFFTTYLPGPSHAGFYLGDDYFIHASSAGEAVVVSQMDSGYYRERFLGGGRPEGWLPSAQPVRNLASTQETRKASPSPSPLQEADGMEVEFPSDADLASSERETPPLVDVEPSVVYFRPDISTVRTGYLTVDDSAPELEARRDAAKLKLELLLGEMVAMGQIRMEELRHSLSIVLGEVADSFQGLKPSQEM